MVEGLPGSGKSTIAEFLSGWLTERGQAVSFYPEGRTDHPVDFEQVAVLSTESLVGVVAAFPAQGEELMRSVESLEGSWLVRYGQHPTWPADLRARLAEHDAYDGAITPEAHRRVLGASWEAFGNQADHADQDETVYVFECVLVQNPLCALMARFDQPAEVIESHVSRLATAVARLNPVVVYLDAGEPTPALERAAAERPREWLDSVIEYHCGQGHGLANGLTGFDGYVEFMRRRRAVELDLLPRLGIPTLTVEVGAGDWAEHRARITAFLDQHLAPGEGLPLGA